MKRTLEVLKVIIAIQVCVLLFSLLALALFVYNLTHRDKVYLTDRERDDLDIGYRL